MVKRDSITFFRSYLEAASVLPPERFKPFILALGAYAFDDEIPSFEEMSLEAMAFILIAPVIDKSKERAAAGAKGGRAKKDSFKVASSYSEQLEQEKEKEQEKEQEQDTEKERNNTQYYSLETDTEKAKEVDTYVSTEKKKEKKEKFSPPTVEEVRAYCAERNNGIDPEAFIDFYASKGWKVGSQPMKDWKASVRTWERRNKDSKPEQRKDEPWHWSPITAEAYDA
jgi:hypothetical protein